MRLARVQFLSRLVMAVLGVLRQQSKDVLVSKRQSFIITVNDLIVKFSGPEI